MDNEFKIVSLQQWVLFIMIGTSSFFYRKCTLNMYNRRNKVEIDEYSLSSKEELSSIYLSITDYALPVIITKMKITMAQIMEKYFAAPYYCKR